MMSLTFALRVVLNLLDERVLVELCISSFKIKIWLKMKGSGLCVRHNNLTSVAIPGSAIACKATRHLAVKTAPKKNKNKTKA